MAEACNCGVCLGNFGDPRFECFSHRFHSGQPACVGCSLHRNAPRRWHPGHSRKRASGGPRMEFHDGEKPRATVDDAGRDYNSRSHRRWRQWVSIRLRTRFPRNGARPFRPKWRACLDPQRAGRERSLGNALRDESRRRPRVYWPEFPRKAFPVP